MRFEVNFGILGEVCFVYKYFYWEKHNLTIMYEGFTEQGLRVYIVAEDVYNLVEVIDNALVISGSYFEKKGGIYE